MELTKAHNMAPKSLYAQFLQEVHGVNIIEHPWGYATYELGPQYVYLMDVYVVPEERFKGRGPQFITEITALAKAQGATKMYTSVAIGSKDPKRSYEIIVRHGFQASHEDAEHIYLVKEI